MRDQLEVWIDSDIHPRRKIGVFLDSAPDRWGQTLMNRRELLAAISNVPTELTRTDHNDLSALKQWLSLLTRTVGTSAPGNT